MTAAARSFKIPPAPVPISRKFASVKWSTHKKNFCILKLSDSREVFLHADDFEGEWPPKYWATVEFTPLETPGQRTPIRAKEARIAEAK